MVLLSDRGEGQSLGGMLTPGVEEEEEVGGWSTGQARKKQRSLPCRPDTGCAPFARRFVFSTVTKLPFVETIFSEVGEKSRIPPWREKQNVKKR